MTLAVLRPGEVERRRPFTILVMANVALAHGTAGARLRRDPVIDDAPLFDACARMIADALEPTGNAQRERLLSTAGLRGRARILALRDVSLKVDKSCAFVREDELSHWLVPRESAITARLASLDFEVDVVFVVTASDQSRRSTAFPAKDDIHSGGDHFEVDGRQLLHCRFSRVPGLVAFSAFDQPWEVIHEFSHAMGSRENGEIVDLYFVGGQSERFGINAKEVTTRLPTFGTMDDTTYPSDLAKTYAAAMRGVHCARNNSTLPAIMANVSHVMQPMLCEHDRITRDFLLARIRTKMRRPDER